MRYNCSRGEMAYIDSNVISRIIPVLTHLFFPINNVRVDKGVTTDEDQISTLEDQIKEIP